MLLAVRFPSHQISVFIWFICDKISKTRISRISIEISCIKKPSKMIATISQPAEWFWVMKKYAWEKIIYLWHIYLWHLYLWLNLAPNQNFNIRKWFANSKVTRTTISPSTEWFWVTNQKIIFFELIVTNRVYLWHQNRLASKKFCDIKSTWQELPETFGFV